MKKLILLVCLSFISIFSFAQSYGVGFKNPQEAYRILDTNGKLLFKQCSDIAGVSIDSMSGVPDSTYNTFKYVANDYNVKVIVVSDHQINYTPNSNTTTFLGNTIVEDYYGKSLEKPMFMVFIVKKTEGMEITLQMYY